MMEHYSDHDLKAQLQTEVPHCLSLAELGAMTEQGSLGKLIRACEEEHHRALSQIADQIARRGIRAVLLAGPSSSGKTTCADRLTARLCSLGLSPVPVSLDDYYIDRDQVRPGPDGELDLEHIDTIDMALFRCHLAALLAGERVALPRFDFTTGRRTTAGRKLCLGDRSVLIIEGIHGLNPALLPEGIHKGEIFRLYICPEYPLYLDGGEKLDDRDLRLIRRIIRDHRTRGTSLARTLSMWDSVGRGERRWILPYRETADAFFNTALRYEPVFLKSRLLPLLEESDACCSSEVMRRIMRLLAPVPGVSDHEDIPQNSILREFIGT